MAAIDIAAAGWQFLPTTPGCTVVPGFVNFALGLLNVPGIVLSIIVGALLITVVAIPALAERWGVGRRAARRKLLASLACRTRWSP
ncbi:MAG: hypothetical protein SXG53_14105 [Pseudomonadota bacterium]|nr:hypothetical protein [Pseudomonadota bacterium]